MPSNYAHYRFGAEMLRGMPGDIRRTADRFRRLYDVGLHGPDLLFYHDLLRQDKFRTAASRIHHQSGREFFTRVCRSLRMNPSQEAEAYLYGALCHYVLDSVCHPLVLEQAEQGTAGHIEIETEFDRFLLELDGKVPPEQQDLSGHLHLTPEEAVVAARFYSGTTQRDIDRCLRNMVLVKKALTMRGNVSRQLLKSSLGFAGEKYRGFVMMPGPNPRCRELNEPLLARYEQARELFPELLLQLGAHLTYNAPLGEDFTAIFG